MNLNKIEALCLANSTNLSQLERDCSLANATIRRWANGSPNVENLIKVANYFDVSLDYLAGREQYDMPTHALDRAHQYASLPPEKQRLVDIYLSVLEVQQ